MVVGRTGFEGEDWIGLTLGRFS